MTSAVYSGDITTTIGYSYDAVGNRLTQDIDGIVTNYGYDDANRLTSVNGVAYTWDDNGNLLSDGVNTYAYDQANRLISVNGQTTFAYNGLGDRLRQTVGGVPTTYVNDYAAGLTQVLSDGTNTYLYGVGRIAQQPTNQPTNFQYFGADGLGSVRQMYDASGTAIANKRYDPFGNVLSAMGAVSVYGFTGEWTDSTGLVYLRARYMDPTQGRFTTRDTWTGDYNNPLSLNGLNYVESNPINRTDPSGRSPLWCGIPLIGCVDTAKNAVLAAKAAYSQVGPILLTLSQKDSWNNRFNCLDPRWSKPERPMDLLADYFCERGPDLVVFSGNDALSIELAKSVLLDEVRKEFYANGDISVPKERKFKIPEFGLALLDSIDASTGETSLPLTHVLGSFDYKVVNSSSGRVEFHIDNRTDLASGTHIPLRFPPDDERDNPISLEQIIQEHPEMENMGVMEVVMDRPEIVSILKPRTRQETPFLIGGGNMYQTFTWSERYLDCGLLQKLPWPVYLPLLDIR